MSAGDEVGKAWCIIRWITLGAITGLLVSSVICYVQPRMYESSVVVAAKETPGRSVALSPFHAAQALRLVSGRNSVTPADIGQVSSLCENTRIMARDGNVEIRVRETNKVDAKDLALELSFLFRSMDEEERLASPVPEPTPLTDVELEVMDDRSTVARLMNEECMAAGCMADFRAVPTLMAQGSPEAAEVWNSESFQMHWDYHADATWKLVGGPRSELPMLPLTAFPIVADTPSSPNIPLYQQTGLFAGFAFGGLLGYRRSLKIKVSGNPKDTDSVRIPAHAEAGPPPLPGSPESRQRYSPEDDW